MSLIWVIGRALMGKEKGKRIEGGRKWKGSRGGVNSPREKMLENGLPSSSIFISAGVDSTDEKLVVSKKGG